MIGEDQNYFSSLAEGIVQVSPDVLMDWLTSKLCTDPNIRSASVPSK
jgi:hypothetical protein